MKRPLIIIFFILVLCGALVSDAEETSPVSEDSLKAAFIFHFITFTQWNDHLSSYYVCIPQDESLKKAAQNLFKGKTINNRNIVVSNYSQFCHVLVSDQAPSTKNTLTIGSLDKGALLEFRLINNKLKFAANVESIKKTTLKISSQLLKLAILENP